MHGLLRSRDLLLHILQTHLLEKVVRLLQALATLVLRMGWFSLLDMVVIQDGMTVLLDHAPRLTHHRLSTTHGCLALHHILLLLIVVKCDDLGKASLRQISLQLLHVVFVASIDAFPLAIVLVRGAILSVVVRVLHPDVHLGVRVAERHPVFAILLLCQVLVLWSRRTLHWGELLERRQDFVILHDLCDLFSLALSHHIRIRTILRPVWLVSDLMNRLILCKFEVDHLPRLVLRPMIILLVLDEVKQEENVSEIDKAISFVRFLGLPVVHRHRQVVESSTVVHLKILLDVISRVPAWNVADH